MPPAEPFPMTTQPSTHMTQPNINAVLLADLPRILDLLEDIASDEPSFPQSHGDDAAEAAETLRHLLALARDGGDPSKPTQPEQYDINAALGVLSAFGAGFPASALVPARVAARHSPKVRRCSSASVLVEVDPLIAWVATLDGETALRLVQSEVLMGWFEGDGDDPETEDADGEFMSTPSVTEDEANPAEDIADALRYCSRDGYIAIG